MKKSLKIILPVLALALLAFLGYKVWAKIQYKNQVVENTESIPDFAYQNIQGSDFKKDDLDKNLPVVFIYFNSECEYCQHEAREIQENIAAFKNTQLLFVSTEQPAKIKEFAQTYKLKTYDNIYFLYDERNHFARTFDATTIPFIAVYNKEHKLIEKFKGQVKVANILAALGHNGHFKN
jgi:peroxiredoxin